MEKPRCSPAEGYSEQRKRAKALSQSELDGVKGSQVVQGSLSETEEFALEAVVGTWAYIPRVSREAISNF